MARVYPARARMNCESDRIALTERWPSGRRRLLGKQVYGNAVPRVRIPPSPPDLQYNQETFFQRSNIQPAKGLLLPAWHIAV